MYIGLFETLEWELGEFIVYLRCQDTYRTNFNKFGVRYVMSIKASDSGGHNLAPGEVVDIVILLHLPPGADG